METQVETLYDFLAPYFIIHQINISVSHMIQVSDLVHDDTPKLKRYLGFVQISLASTANNE